MHCMNVRGKEGGEEGRGERGREIDQVQISMAIVSGLAISGKDQ